MRSLSSTAFGLLLVSICALNILLVSAGCGEPSADSAATEQLLTDGERAEGWRPLFDGGSFEGWRGLGRESVPGGHWRVEDGAIRKVAVDDVPPEHRELSGDIMTVETFRDFELTLQWKIAPGANTGIKYNVSEEMSLATRPTNAALGFEYQMIDDGGFSKPLELAQLTAALYDLVPPATSETVRPAGKWNDTRIILRGSRGEHWLNGEKVVEFDLESDTFAQRLAASKFKEIDGFSDRRRGHIVLQDHSDDAWFRRIKIRTFETGS